MRFVLPIDFLPQDEHQRYELLHGYFCDQRGRSYQENGKWVVELYWPAKQEYFVDPKIEEGFHWWNPAVPLNKGHEQLREMPGYQLSLNDSWTLYAWSKWLAKQIQSTGFPPEVILLHVDYHSDLMSPRLGYSDGNYSDLLTKETFDIKEPETVRKAILSGAIGVGSFMVPFLHEVPRVHLRHLCEGHLTEKHGHVNALSKAWEKDTLLAVDEIRPKVDFKRINENDLLHHAISYKITDKTEEWLENLPSAPILLHIDMDYFNCRYDGDSDWENRPLRHDPTLPNITEKMEQLFNAICTKGLQDQVKDVTVALSPGFFPAEYWQPGIQMISKLIQMLKT